MGIFTRLRDIVSSNINSMLDKAEDPEKLLRLMIQEMEDTLIEIKAQCAAAMAQSKTFTRQIDEVCERADEWAAKARLAVEKGRDDLGREALLEKRRYQERVDALETQRVECDELIEQYRSDIEGLDGKIQSLRERQKVLLQRHAHAESKRRAEQHIRKANGSDILSKLEVFEKRIDHMEAEADLVNYGKKPTLDQEFRALEKDEDLEKELDKLRRQVKGKDAPQA